MLRALALSVRQLPDRAVLSVLAKSLGVTLAIFAALGTGLYVGLVALLDAVAGWRDGVGVLMVTALFVSVVAMWLLFRVVAVAVMGIFADDVVQAVEARHYPQALKTARPVPFRRGLAMGLRSGTRAVGWNLLAAPFYLALILTGIGAPILFFAVNAALLGRDLGDMVAARHVEDLPTWRRGSRAGRGVLGLVSAGLFVVPGVNLLAPVIGAAMATHWFHTRSMSKGPR